MKINPDYKPIVMGAALFLLMAMVSMYSALTRWDGVKPEAAVEMQILEITGREPARLFRPARWHYRALAADGKPYSDWTYTQISSGQIVCAYFVNRDGREYVNSELELGGCKK